MPRVLLNTEASHPMLGNLLDQRYQIVQVLSTGTFRRTYIAEDATLPGKPKRAIKHLKPASNDPNYLQTVRHLFLSETETLKRLGEHDRIPQVLAYFEDDQGFYLVQEFIEGQPLSTLLPTSLRCGKRWQEKQVIQLLEEVSSILEFVHSQDVIHCDIKPNNIIKRASDGKYCLIEFGSLQPIGTPAVNVEEEAEVTFPLEPAGYVPPEQLAYHPQPNSDIYALGTIAIQALTGMYPALLQIDTNLTSWQKQVKVSDGLVSVVNQMVRLNYKERYQKATEVIQALENLGIGSQATEFVGSGIGAIDSEKLNITFQPLAQQSPTIIEESEVADNIIGAIDSQILEIPPNQFPAHSETQTENSEQIQDLAVNSVVESSPLESLLFAPQTQLDESSPTPEIADSPESPAKPKNNKTGFRFPKIPPLVAVFGIGMAMNALAAMAGYIYISQPDPNQFKQFDSIIDQVQWEEGSKKVCQIPYICFWEKKQKSLKVKAQTPVEVYQLRKKAFALASNKDFAGAVTLLEQISPQTPDYAKVKAKIAEYKQKQRIKQAVEKSGDAKMASKSTR